MTELKQATHEMVGEEFVKVLRDGFPDEQWPEMRRRNVQHTTDGVCASQDYGDANMAMLAAFENLGLKHPAELSDGGEGPEWQASVKLWNDAWEYAKTKHLTASTDVCIAGNPALDGVCGDDNCVCSQRLAVPATNVFDYFDAKLGTKPSVTEGEDISLKDFPLDSECGRICKNIIDKADELLSICDPHERVVNAIHAGVVAAVNIVCFG